MENQNIVLQQTVDYVKSALEGEGSGHDWWHIYRVWKTATTIGQGENVDLYVVQLAALLHDIADWKFHGGDETIGPRKAREWLESLKVDTPTVAHVVEIISTISFKGAGENSRVRTREAMVVQDADRLDAIGAIGIARTFAYGGHKGREIYNPAIQPELNQTSSSYKSNTSPTINHFYEKLLLLKDLMNTQTARNMATERHRFMEEFLERFYEEWDGRT
jgi:uncharacterized protein